MLTQGFPESYMMNFDAHTYEAMYGAGWGNARHYARVLLKDARLWREPVGLLRRYRRAGVSGDPRGRVHDYRQQPGTRTAHTAPAGAA